MRQVQKNFIIGVVSESLWGMGFGLFMPATLVSLALVDLGGSATLAGLLAALFGAGLTLPQAFSALAIPPRFTDPKRVVLLHLPALTGPLVAGSGFVLVPAAEPSTRLFCLLAGFSIFALGIGLVVPHWVGMIGRCLPEKIRGRYFGTSFFFSGLCSSLTGWLGAGWAARGGTDWGYELCFLLAVPFMALSILVMLMLKPLVGRPQPVPSGSLRRSFQILGSKLIEPGPFRIGLALVFLLIGALAPCNLFTVYLRQEVHLDTSWFEIFTPAMALGAMVGAFLLGFLADHKGLRAAWGAAFLAGLASLGCIYFHWNPFMSGFAFAGFGFLGSSYPVISLVMILKIAGKRESTVQTGLFNTLNAPWNFIAPLLAGWVASKADYGWTFGFGVVCCLTAFWLILTQRLADGMKKKRKA